MAAWESASQSQISHLGAYASLQDRADYFSLKRGEERLLVAIFKRKDPELHLFAGSPDGENPDLESGTFCNTINGDSLSCTSPQTLNSFVMTKTLGALTRQRAAAQTLAG